MEQTRNSYQRFQDQKKQVEVLLGNARKIFSGLNMTPEEEKIKKMEEKIRSETFKVMVLGRFNVGKSTFINALLGKEILPAYAIPCTAVINEVKYSETKRARLFFKDPLPQKIPDGISPQALKYIREYKGRSPEPLEIPVSDLKEFVVIPDPAKEQAESIAETPYERVELYWDLALCKDGVEIIDSPGLDESISRNNITVNYLTRADAILFVMSCESLCSLAEMDYIENNIRNLGHEYVFFVNNKINQVRKIEREEVMKLGNTKLATRTEFGTKGIFYINALGALEGRLENDDEQVVASGIRPLEDLLADFLTNKKGKVKILQPVKEFILAIRKGLFDVIPLQRGLLDTSLEEISRRYEEQKPRLSNLEAQKNLIIREIAVKIEKAGFDIRREIESNLSYVISNTAGWVGEIVVEKKFDPFHPKKSGAAIVTEILEKLQSRMESEQIKWVKDKLTPLMEVKMEETFTEREDNLKKFYIALEDVKIELSGVSPEEAGLKEKSTAERIGATIVGLFVDAGSAWYGYNFGFSKGLYRQMGIQLGAIFTMIFVFGILNPITMLPVILAIAAAGIFTGKGAVAVELKKTISTKVLEELQKNRQDTSDKMTEGILSKMRESARTIQAVLEGEIGSVKTQVEQILKDKMADEQVIDRKVALINQCEADLKKMDQELNDLLLSIAER
ncbi:MAG TPA: dynamin family protein [Puia sp.]|jgi:GTPase Era involved in 16S rRNA processing|nr:dynamin family protein [Puia sp.]